MTGTQQFPQSIIDSQRRAADPAHSAWVSANAGSGKTHVLSRRVIRLLLQGTDPSRILCLTYTRAAAAEMSNRVFRDLGHWALMEEGELAETITNLEGHRPDAEVITRARRLFARALETPGGLKIQTIHAFCEAVLHRFPLEANIAGRFELADQAIEAQMLAEARRQMLTLAGSGTDSDLTEALHLVLDHCGEAGFDRLVGEIIANRDAIAPFMAQTEKLPARDMFMREFGFRPGETEQDIATAAWPLAGFDREYVTELLDHARAEKTRTAADFAEKILALGDNGDACERFSALTALFMTAAGEMRSTRYLCAAKVIVRFPDLQQRFEAAADTIRQALDRIAQLQMITVTDAALTLAGALISRYERLKTARGLLDFNDLITRTANLFDRPDAGPWIQFKLDQGIDHILVDEAQDTSPKQWAVISRLAREFFTGGSARSDEQRTIFAVGDEKQSIYSFQGADPEIFHATRRDFATRIETMGGTLQEVGLNYSFRSTADVLSAVDLVFTGAEARRGLTRDPEDIVHNAIRDKIPGFVQLWGSIGEESVDAPEDWRQSIDHASAAAVRLAELIADTIKGWLAGSATSPLAKDPVSPGDIMILVRKRDRFIHALSRALKNRHIAVAGTDRIKLRDHIAIKDLMALGRFALQPDDDLSLAAFLKSPVFGLDEDALMAIAIDRPPNQSLFEALKAHAGHREIVGRLETWREQARQLPVFDFFARVLGRDGVRNRMIARLGNEAGDLLDEFLGAALSFERNGQSGMEAFLAAISTYAPEVKRQANSSRDEIRIMTVHAAKGLEARIVFLVDSGGAPVHSSHLPNLLPVVSSGRHWQGTGYVWKASKKINNTVTDGVAETLKRKAEDEYHRLLYVAMTRAADGLIVAGYHSKTRNDDAWHAMVERALMHDALHETDPRTGLPLLTYRITPHAEQAPEPAEVPETLELAVPDFVSEKVAPPPPMPRPLAPSGVSAVVETGIVHQAITVSPVLQDDVQPGFALERGIVIHRLLQKLPELPETEWPGAITRYLAVAGRTWNKTERDHVSASVLSVLYDKDFAGVFAPGSRAEVTVMGTLQINGRPRAVSGKIDRLVATGGTVCIVDYKTNRPPPLVADAVPEGYVAQMALYRALIAPLYPDKSVHAALLFTETPQLIVLPEMVMDKALARLKVT